MIPRRRSLILFVGLALLLSMNAFAIEMQRGIIRLSGDVLCLNHCGDLYLEADTGFQSVMLTGFNLTHFVGLHVEVRGYHIWCGECLTLNVTNVDFVSVDEAGSFSSTFPAEPQLFQNYPNPFNPVTDIEFQVTTFGYVSLTVYNSLAERVATLVHETLGPGVHRVAWDGSGLPSGAYYYVLQAGKTTHSKTMLLLR